MLFIDEKKGKSFRCENKKHVYVDSLVSCLISEITCAKLSLGMMKNLYYDQNIG